MRKILVGFVLVAVTFFSVAPAPALTIEELQAAEKELESYLISDGLIEVLKLYRECRTRCMFLGENMKHWECRRLCVFHGAGAAERELKR
jgi:hypothetical protein